MTRYKFEGMQVGATGPLGDDFDFYSSEEEPSRVISDLVRVCRLDDGKYVVYWKLIVWTTEARRRLICEDRDHAAMVATMVGRSESDRLTRKQERKKP
jgi:hypothetical protein